VRRTLQPVDAWVLPLPAIVVILMVGVQQLWFLRVEVDWFLALGGGPSFITGFAHGLAGELMRVNLLLAVYLWLAFRERRRSQGLPGVPGYLLFLGAGILLAGHQYALSTMANPLPHYLLRRLL
jgi:hypothetical protein